MATPELPPRKKKSAPTTILALGDDLLREVFLRLPSLPSLVRAALACPAFLGAVRSSPAFRRRFRDLHSPALLSLFLVNEEATPPTYESIRLRRRSDPDHAAALRGLDATLTLLPNEEDEGEDAENEDVEDEEEEDGPRWSMCGCRDGYVPLLKPRWNTEKVAIYDPVTRALHIFLGPPDELFSGESEDTEAEFHVVTSQGDDRSFRVLCISKENGVARVAILSPDKREWQISPTPGRFQDEGNGTLVNGFVCWAIQDRAFIPVLNTTTLQFSQIDLPPPMRRSFYTYYKAGETKDGELCLVSGSDLDLDVWIRGAGNDGVDTWMPGGLFWMEGGLDKLGVNITDEYPSLNLVAVIGGIVYFSIHQEDPPIWLLSFCIETMVRKKLCPLTPYEFCYPYIMAWPPSLVRNQAEAV